MTPSPLESGNTPRVGALINPLSGKNSQRLAAIAQTIRKYPDVLVQQVETPQDIYDALIDFNRKNINILIISGGDGTVQGVLTVLFHHQPFAIQPQLIVIAGGTTNMIAGDVGISGDQAKAVHRLLQWAQSGSGKITRIQRPVLRLHVPGHEVKYGMFFGAAAISQGIHYYRKNLHNKKLGGIPGISMTIFRFLWEIICKRSQLAISTHISVRLNKQPCQKEDFMLLFVSTLNKLFFGLRPFWGFENGPLQFTAVRSRAKYLPQVLPFLARGHMIDRGTKENGYYSHNVNEIELYIEDSVALDGEIYTPESRKKPTVLEYGGRITFLRV
ncbi:diacylglycerol/lipid kinase family protein [Desulfobacter sp.]|uniref:diacylglycerol/lipid kinase family protein n=1 Tax=Desulfobacter sp. TaxID=2294 RepID=UPI003D13E8DC